MNGRDRVVLGLWMMSVPVTASARRIEASADAAQLAELLLPAGVDHARTLCEGDCPTGVRSLRVTAPALALIAGAVETRGTVHVDLSVLGGVEADVVCAIRPALGESGRVSLLGQGCRIDRLAGVPSVLRRTVIAKLEPALGMLLDDQLDAADAYDLLAGARDGLLAWYAPDAAVRAPAAARCVEGIRDLEVRGGDVPVIVATVDVGCTG